MKKSNINYPYPVLSVENEDYIDSEFDITYDSGTLSSNAMTFSILYSLNCDGLKNLIDEGKAKVSLYVESPICNYRKLFDFEKGYEDLEIKIMASEVTNYITIKGYIIANEKIKNFRLEEHNQDLFGNMPFTVRKGDILAIAESVLKIPLKHVDNLQNQSSIFCVRKKSDLKDSEVLVDYNDDRISIYLDNETYKVFQDLSNTSIGKGLASSMVVVPILVEALHMIKTNTDESFNDFRWVQVIQSKITELNIDLDQGLNSAANKILSHIFKYNLLDLKNLCEKVTGDE